MPPLNWRAPRGVYALKHLPTQKTYIGSTINLPSRWKKWKAELTFNEQELPSSFPRTGLQDWDFIVLKNFPDTATAKDLEDVEHELIAKYRLKSPELILNSRKQGEFIRAEHDGEMMTFGEMSRRTGVQEMTLRWRWKNGRRGADLVAATGRKKA